MQWSNAPAKISTPFANNGSKNTIPVASQIAVTPGAASFTDGFPPLTMVDYTKGGIAPSGLDFNGILYDLSTPLVWAAAGAGYQFDATFAAAIGGYPAGTRLLRADGLGYWRNVLDNNMNNPDVVLATVATGWRHDGRVLQYTHVTNPWNQHGPVWEPGSATDVEILLSYNMGDTGIDYANAIPGSTMTLTVTQDAAGGWTFPSNYTNTNMPANLPFFAIDSRYPARQAANASTSQTYRVLSTVNPSAGTGIVPITPVFTYQG